MPGGMELASFEGCCPPSMTRMWPLRWLAAGDSIQRMVRAISSGLAILLRGFSRARFLYRNCFKHCFFLGLRLFKR